MIEDHLNNSVFTAKNHYLSHMAYMTRLMGPMKHYSCRPTERTIKSFTTNIRSTTNPGVNSSNILFGRATTNQHGLQELVSGSVDPEVEPLPGNVSFLELADGQDNYPQLWDPSQKETMLIDGEVMPGLSDNVLLSAVQSYYRRLYPGQPVHCSVNTVRLAGRMWSDSNVYSSRLYRNQHQQVTAADNFVLFEAGRNGR